MKDIKEKTVATYDKIASRFTKSRLPFFWRPEIKRYETQIPGKKVLDIGCGSGRDAAIFITDNFEYVGIDASQEMINLAKSQVPAAMFMRMDFYKLDFADETFDGFWAAASLFHAPKHEIGIILSEAKRITRSGGIGFIALKERTDTNEGLIYEEKYGGIERFFAFYEKEEFKQILSKNGFEVLEITEHLDDEDKKTNWLCYLVRKPFRS